MVHPPQQPTHSSVARDGDMYGWCLLLVSSPFHFHQCIAVLHRVVLSHLYITGCVWVRSDCRREQWYLFLKFRTRFADGFAPALCLKYWWSISLKIDVLLGMILCRIPVVTIVIEDCVMLLHDKNFHANIKRHTCTAHTIVAWPNPIPYYLPYFERLICSYYYPSYTWIIYTNTSQLFLDTSKLPNMFLFAWQFVTW